VNVRMPVEATLERGTAWENGASRLSTHSRPTSTIFTKADRDVIPPRERQIAQTLTDTPGLTHETSSGHAIVDLLGHNNAWYLGTPEETLRAVAAPELVEDLHALHTKLDATSVKQQHGIRFVHPELGSFSTNTTTRAQMLEERALRPPETPAVPKIKKAAERMQALYVMDYETRKRRFFQLDPLNDEGPQSEPYGAKPEQYRGLLNLKENLGFRFASRADLQRSLGETVPRKEIFVITRERAIELRFPAHGPFRGCRLGDMCIVHLQARIQGVPENGYCEREYLSLDEERAQLERRHRLKLPASDELDGPAQLCFDDLIYAYSNEFHLNAQPKRAPRECVNIFTMADGVYDASYLIPAGEAGRSTGIEGRVPQFLPHTRMWTKRTLPDGKSVSYWEDTAPAFEGRLSQKNTCFDAYKARPFLGHSRFHQRSSSGKSVFLPRTALEKLASPADGWVRFLHECHSSVLVDRHLLAAAEDSCGRAEQSELSSRLPVVWLRRFLLQSQPRQFRHTQSITVQGTRALRYAFRLGSAPEHALSRLLEQWSDAFLGSFERSVAVWLDAVRKGRIEMACVPILLFLGVPIVTSDARDTRGFWNAIASHARHHAVPESVRNLNLLEATSIEDACTRFAAAVFGRHSNDDQTHVIWAVGLWRVASIHILDHVLTWESTQQRDNFNRQTHLFADTHLDLFTALALRFKATGLVLSDHVLFTQSPPPKASLFDDEPAATSAPSSMRGPQPWLALFYPSAHRLCTIEELPDLAPTMMYANPWYDMGSSKTALAFLLMLLQLLILKLRNETCQRRQFVEILRRDMEIHKSLGELVRLICKVVLLGNLPNATSRLPFSARIRVNASFAPFTTHSSDLDFLQWIESHRLTTWFLLREFYFYHVENTYILERAFGESCKWSRFKALVRLANGETRAELARQVAGVTDNAVPVDWDACELSTLTHFDKKGKACYSITGLIMDRHERSLDQFTKLKKGRFEEIFKKKSKAIEKDLDIVYPDAYEWLRADNRLYYCHLVTWYLAERSHADTTPLQWQLVMETRWLKWLGMSEEGLAQFRNWIFEYYEYDIMDNSLKALSISFYRRNWRDYVLARSFCRLFQLYREQRTYVVSRAATVRTVNALRASMRLENWKATPYHVGRHYYCEGCHQWASRVQPTSLIMLGEIVQCVEAHDVMCERARRFGPSLSATEVRSICFESNPNEAAICSFRSAFMDPLRGQLFCERSNFKNPGGLAPLVADPDSIEPETQAVATHPLDDLALMNEKQSFQWLRNQGRKKADGYQTLFNTNMETSPLTATPAQNNNTHSQLGKIDDVSVLSVSNLSCNNPLTEIDMIGVYQRLHGRLYGLCVFCGVACEMLNCNMTALGLQCGRHALALSYADDHRLWLAIGRSREEVIRAATVPLRMPLCFGCVSVPAVRFLEAYDFQNRLFHLPLCSYHLACCSSLVPITPQLHPTGTHMVVPPPVRIDHIVAKIYVE
jgi:hypothetical protein